jgi:hypothetical protein
MNEPENNSIDSVPPDDVPAAVAFVRARAAAGRLSDEILEPLLNRQRNPAELLAALQTAFRNDGVGTPLALRPARGTVSAMAKRRDADGNPDPDDLAHRNAANPERADEPDDEDEDDLDEEDREEDDEEVETYDTASMYDDEGALTEAASKRIGASSFAVPGKNHLPIHEPAAVKDSMKRFGSYEFDSSELRHAAFNRIAAKADQFKVAGLNKFRRSHGRKLDHRKDDHDMTSEQLKAEAAKSRQRKDERDQARKDLETANGKIASLEKDLDAERAKNGARTDAAQVEFDNRVNDKVELVTTATRILGAGKVTAKTPDGDIKRAVIKHVDSEDVPADKHPAYVDALFDGAVKRADKAVADKATGAAALAAARGAGTPPVLPTVNEQPGANPNPAVPHADAGEETEAQAVARMSARSRSTYKTPGKMNKAGVLAGGSN